MPTRKRKPTKAVEPEYTGPAFPFPDGEYLAVRTMSRRGHWSGAEVGALRSALGLSAGQVFDEETYTAVVAFQGGAGLPTTGVVGREDWERLHTPQEDVPAPEGSGASDGAGVADEDATPAVE